MMCLFLSVTMSMPTEGQDDQADEQEIALAAFHRNSKVALLAARSHGVQVPTDAAYRMLSQGMPEHATKVAKNLFDACIYITRLAMAHGRRTQCFLELYKENKAMTTEVFEVRSKQNVPVRCLKTEVDKHIYKGHRNLDPATLQLLKNDEYLEETRQSCIRVAGALKEYDRLSTPTELAQAHTTYAYHIGKEFGKCFLVDPDLQDAAILNQNGRLMHSTQGPKVFYEDVKSSHLPTLLRAKSEKKARQTTNDVD